MAYEKSKQKIVKCNFICMEMSMEMASGYRKDFGSDLCTNYAVATQASVFVSVKMESHINWRRNLIIMQEFKDHAEQVSMKN